MAPAGTTQRTTIVLTDPAIPPTTTTTVTTRESRRRNLDSCRPLSATGIEAAGIGLLDILGGSRGRWPSSPLAMALLGLLAWKGINGAGGAGAPR